MRIDRLQVRIDQSFVAFSSTPGSSTSQDPMHSSYNHYYFVNSVAMNRVIVLFILVLAVSCVCGRLSGIYLDNGLDQTVIQKLLTKQDKRHIEQEILNLLGLPNRPKPMMPMHLDKSAPKFLIDVYQRLLDTDVDRLTRSEFSVSGDDQKAIDESDVIMSFSSQKYHVDGIRHDGRKRLWFDVTEVPVEDTIVGAELRIYQSPNLTRTSSKRHHHVESDYYTVTAYQIIQTQKGGFGLQYVDSLNTTAHNEGWLVFNLTGPLTTWVAIPNLNYGLYISISPHGHPSQELHLDEIGMVPSKGEEGHQPFMVAFFKSTNDHGENRLRQTRETTTRRRKKKSQNNPEDHTYSSNPLLHHGGHWMSQSCQMQNMYVSFKDLKWQDWIIAPDGYQAFFCSGECNFPLNAHMNATNHAIVQTLAHLIKPLEVPKPCCAPTKLSAISVLYYQEDSNVILKKYKNMVVKSCGCH